MVDPGSGSVGIGLGSDAAGSGRAGGEFGITGTGSGMVAAG